jgi:Domain of unknown function (DUF4157)
MPPVAAAPEKKTVQAQSPVTNPLWQALALGVRPKLAVSSPDDPEEREADHIADRVMRMPADTAAAGESLTLLREPTLQRACAACADEDEHAAMRKPAGGEPAAEPGPGWLARLGAGTPLAPDLRGFFEPRLGADLGRVRVHTDGAAAATRLHARAFAYGPHVAFAASEYAPQTPTGRRLIAHELAHVAQQRTAPATPRIRRQTLTLRNSNQLGVSTSPAKANLKGEAVDALARLMDLWAIDVPTYDTTLKTTWAKYGDADVIAGADLKPLTDAITKNETPTLAAAVANNFLALNPPIADGVGVGSTNNAADVSAVQTALIAHGFLSSGSAGGSVDTATASAIKSFKQSVAAGRFGIVPLRPDEVAHAHDRFAGGTFRFLGDPVTVTLPAQPAKGSEPAHPASTKTLDKTLTVYVPHKAAPGKNKVDIFFTPLPDELKFVNEEGLRSEHDASEWILIAVPGLFEAIKPNWVTISTAEIVKCLRAVQRGTNIDAIRLTAHSRGHRGLEHTMGSGGAPLIDLKLVERVTVFDASYSDLGTALSTHTKDLTRMQDPAHPASLAAGTVNLYDVTVGNVSGFKGKTLDVAGIRALAYVRFVEEGLAFGKIDKVDIDMLKSDPTKDVRAATRRLLAALRGVPRGSFSTRSPTPAGKTDLPAFLASNRSDLHLVDDRKDGLSPLVTANHLDLGYGFDLNPKDPNRSLSAHHWLAAELGHEAVD